MYSSSRVTPFTRCALVAFAATLTLAAGALVPASIARAEALPREGTCADNPFPDANPGPGSLTTLRPQEPADLSTYIASREAAIVLGKALFWDMQVGSDGRQACASCHFRAGADPRSKNQLGKAIAQHTIELGGPNYQLRSSDFPLHQFVDPTNRFSPVIRSFDDVVSSQGVKLERFVGVVPGETSDRGAPMPDPVFNVGGHNTRRVEPRNTPTVINAAFNRRNLWDGRADPIFNGVNEFGVRDPNARVLRADRPHEARLVKVRIEPGSLASQAVGPVRSDTEMAFVDRPFRDLGKRLVPATPLAQQKIAWDDSVFFGWSRSTPHEQRRGLAVKYQDLIRIAFQPRWWNSRQIVAPNGDATLKPDPRRPLRANEYAAIEYNFSLYFGLAVQMYEATLISDRAPVDRWFEGDTNALTAQQIEGLALFDNEETACAACHSGAEFTNASRRIILGAEGEPAEVIERMFNGNCEVVIYDQSFYNIGVRPADEDLGIGADDPFGNPLGIATLLTMDPARVPSPELLTIPYPNIANPPPQRGERVSNRGAFKVPSLRNVELTAPYFHNGGQLTLRQVVEFYNRGGDFRERNAQWIDFEIGRIGLDDHEIDAIVAFLRALTDPRVLSRQAPFDHPQLFVANGHVGDTRTVDPLADGSARDEVLEIPAVGRGGGVSLPGFLEPR